MLYARYCQQGVIICDNVGSNYFWSLYHEAGLAGLPGKFQFSLCQLCFFFYYHSNLHSTANLLRGSYVLV